MTINAAELKEFIDTLPGEPDEWTPSPDKPFSDGFVLRFYRADPNDATSLGWTRAYIDLFTGDRAVSDAPPTADVGLVFTTDQLDTPAGETA